MPLWSLISGLLVKAGGIGKVSSAEPLFAGWFAELLSRREPRLARCLAIVWWKGGNQEREKPLFEQADLIAAYGSTQTLERIRANVPASTPFLPFGHKMSFSIVAHQALDSHKGWQTATAAGRDVAFYDQQGCYSPHIIFVQKGGSLSPQEFARCLAHELNNFEHKYPRRRLSLEEAALFSQWKQEQEFTALSAAKTEVIGDEASAWTVAYYGEQKKLKPSPLNRTIQVIAFDRLQDIISLLLPFRSLLQSVGLAAPPKELFAWSEQLGEAGVTRIAALGQMTSPEAGWHHDGRFNLADFVRMVDIEHSAESYAERLAPYVD